jgi:GAF domain-containing protein
VSEKIDLPPVSRGTLLPEDERVARLECALPMIVAAVAGEHDPILLQATLACLVWEAMPQASWVGFYRRVGERMLSVGPYQGPMGCLHIAFDRGVCGACARTGTTQLVADVRAFADHIACDDATRSEVVVPVFGRGVVQAVLDLDSHHLAAFSPAEAVRLERLVAEAFGGETIWTWG